MKSTITFTNNITVENYNALRAAVDWIQVTEKRASIALQHSFYLCVAMDGERPVGMARIVSDGGYTYFITDVIVHPDYQGYHIGTELISRVLDYIQKDVMDGETVMGSLMAAYKWDSFYHRFGFHSRPFGNHGSGMSMWVSRDISGKIITACRFIIQIDFWQDHIDYQFRQVFCSRFHAQYSGNSTFPPKRDRSP